MKKIVTIILLSFSNVAFPQTKAIQVKDMIYLYNSATITNQVFCDGLTCANNLVLGSDTLCSIYDNGIVLWKSTIAAASISDTLSATGITGLCRITVPTSINTQRCIQFGDFVIIYSTATYTAVYSNSVINSNILPITIRRNSDSVVMCRIYANGVVDWVTTPLMSWTGRVGTTRFKRVTLP